MPQIVILNQVRVPPNLFKDLKGAAKLKRLKNTALGVNFTNILQAAFAPIFLSQKSTNLKSKYKKALRKPFVRKSRAYNVGEIDTRLTNYFV